MLKVLEAFGVDDQESPEEIEQLLEQFKQGQISASDVAHILLGIKKGPKVEWENVPAHYELSR